jgi:hypothetical protein
MEMSKSRLPSTVMLVPHKRPRNLASILTNTVKRPPMTRDPPNLGPCPKLYCFCSSHFCLPTRSDKVSLLPEPTLSLCPPNLDSSSYLLRPVLCSSKHRATCRKHGRLQRGRRSVCRPVRNAPSLIPTPLLILTLLPAMRATMPLLPLHLPLPPLLLRLRLPQQRPRSTRCRLRMTNILPLSLSPTDPTCRWSSSPTPTKVGVSSSNSKKASKTGTTTTTTTIKTKEMTTVLANKTPMATTTTSLSVSKKTGKSNSFFCRLNQKESTIQKRHDAHWSQP